MKKPMSFFTGLLLFFVLICPVGAGDVVIMHAGDVRSVNEKEIVLNYQDSDHKYVITPTTRICVDGYQADSWRELENAQTATVTTELESNIAIRIDNCPMQFAMGGLGGLRPIVPDCRPKARKAQVD